VIIKNPLDYDHKLQVMAILIGLCSDRSRAQQREMRAGGLVCRESTRKSRRVPGLAGLPESVGTEMPTGKQFRQMPGQSRAVVGGWLQEFLYGLDELTVKSLAPPSL